MNSIVCMLEDTARKFPDHIALEDSEGEMTYAALRRDSRTAAAFFLKKGLRRGQCVAVYLPKSNSCVVSFYGALYCGVSYAPMDFTAPTARIFQMLQNLCPAVIVTNGEGRDKLAELPLPGTEILDYADLLAGGADDAAVDRTLRATIDADPAYIMYTSGSTGIPKGVVIPHRGVIDYARFIAETYSVTDSSVIGLQSGFHFDNSVFDLYAAMLTGAKVLIIPEILFMYPVKLMEYVKEKDVSCVFWVPTIMNLVANCGALENISLPALKTVVFAGEVMPNKQLNVWRRHLPHCLYSNLYGPTEITVDCTCYIVDREFADTDPLPIGYERDNMRVIILKDDGTEAAPMEMGELCIVGSQLALGYWNNPGETARAFTANPLNTTFYEKMYHTGDLAYKCEDGLIMFVGRKDSQIKIRGIRVELGDIETAARAIPGLDNVCALFDHDKGEIVLFVETQTPVTKRVVNAAMGKLVPKYMLPARVICMERFPLNANRKIDRLQLRTMM